MSDKLYKWQADCLNKWIENAYQGIVDAATGTGKTTLALNAMKTVFSSNLRIKIIVPTVNLVFQWKKEIIKYFGKKYEDDIALIYGGSKYKTDALFSIYVINSARYTISKAIIKDMNGGFDVFLICDETHRYLSKENKKVFHYLFSDEFKKDHFYSLGLSATVDEEDVNNILAPALGKKIYTYNHNDALKDKVISPFVIYETAVNFNITEREEYLNLSFIVEVLYKKIIKKYPDIKYISDYKSLMKYLNTLAKDDEEVDRYLKLLLKRRKVSLTSQTRIKCGIEIIKNLLGKKVIVFAERITQIKQFEQELINNGIKKIATYHSKQSDEYRKHTLQDYKDGTINILLTCKALDEGVDVPDAEVAIVLSSSSVSRQRIQRLGRILRKNENKSMASLFYIYVSDANDDPLYLEDLYFDNNTIMRLRYYDVDNCFSNPTYENIIMNFYKTIRKNTDIELLKEYNRCLENGLLRTDWLLSIKELEDKISKCKSLKDKNYYTVMKKIKDYSK